MLQRTVVAPHDSDAFTHPRLPAIARTSTRVLMLVWEACPKGKAGTVTGADPATPVPLDLGPWEEGDYPRRPTTLRMSRSFDNGLSWEEPRNLVSGSPEEGIGYHEPSFLHDHVTGRMFCFYTRSISRPDDASHPEMSFFVAWTDDDGMTWEHRDITSMIIGGRDLSMAYIPRGRGTQLTAGTWAQRLCHSGVVVDHNGDRKAVFIGSDDHGITWWSSKPVGSDVDYCSAVQNNDGSEVILLMKPRGDAKKLWAKSTDGGRTFGEADPDIDSALINIMSPLEEVFHGAQPGTPHADVLSYIGERMACTGECTVLMLSTDDAQSFREAAIFDAQTYGSVDIVSMADQAKFAITYVGPRGVMCEILPFVKIRNIKTLAEQWASQS